MSNRKPEVSHEGGIVYLDGYGMTEAEADMLARAIQAAASEARGWAVQRKRAAKVAAEIARLEASGLTHIASSYGCHLARRAGLPVVVGELGERPARYRSEVGDGPPLEARIYGGRKWWPMSEVWLYRHVSAWRVVGAVSQ